MSSVTDCFDSCMSSRINKCFKNPNPDIQMICINDAILQCDSICYPNDTTNDNYISPESNELL